VIPPTRDEAARARGAADYEDAQAALAAFTFGAPLLCVVFAPPPMPEMETETGQSRPQFSILNWLREFPSQTRGGDR
jgi:hypothetical protein